MVEGFRKETLLGGGKGKALNARGVRLWGGGGKEKELPRRGANLRKSKSGSGKVYRRYRLGIVLVIWNPGPKILPSSGPEEKCTERAPWR